MADFKILCPACTAVLNSKKPIPNGKKITCPNCKKPFVAATGDAGSDSGSVEFEWSPPSTGVTTHATPRPSPSRTIERPAVRPHARAAATGSNKAVLWIIMLLLLVVALGGGGVGVYFYIKTQELQTVQERDKKKKDKEKEKAVVVAQAKDKKGEAAKDDKQSKAASKNAGNKEDGESRPTSAANPKEDGPKPKPGGEKAPAKPRVAEWLEYKSEPGGYVIQFPAKPTDRRERDDDLIYYESAAELNGFEYEVIFHQLKKDDVMPVKDRLKKLADEYKDVTILKKELEFEQVPKIPAMEVTMFKNGKKDVAVERLIVYRDHVFQISVTGDKEKLGPDQVAQFMKSFRFVGEPKGGFLDLAQTQGIPPERRKR